MAERPEVQKARYREPHEGDIEEIPRVVHETDIAVAQPQPSLRDPTISLFQNLPAELRLKIYNHVLDLDAEGWASRPRKSRAQDRYSRVCQPKVPNGLGFTQKLLWINKLIRAEVSAEIFQFEVFDFSGSVSWDLTMVRDVLTQIGEAGRNKIKELRSINWWGRDWNADSPSDNSRSEKDAQCAAAVVKLIGSCKNLERLSVRYSCWSNGSLRIMRPSEVENLFGVVLFDSITQRAAGLATTTTHWFRRSSSSSVHSTSN